jgi:hypothetical protein
MRRIAKLLLCNAVWSSTLFFSSIFPYQTYDNGTIFISARGPWPASVFLWTVILSRSAIFKFVETQTLPCGWKHSGHQHSIKCDESHYDSLLCLENSDHSAERKLVNIFSHIGHFDRLRSLDTWWRKTTLAQWHRDVPRRPCTSIINTRTFNIGAPS